MHGTPTESTVPLSSVYGTAIIDRPHQRVGLELYMVTAKRNKKSEQKVLAAPHGLVMHADVPWLELARALEPLSD